ncbi:sialoadhesin-like [Natator depressus]|uniref:sialoadhesin-like n=1 Tax=Natator depressus TaxID=27790 RepID=UPI003EC156DC
MALVLVPAFCLLTGAYAQEWGVTLAPGPLARGTGSCVTIPCSFTYPVGWTVWAVIWTRDEDQTVYHSDEARVHPEFEGRARYLGDLQRDCSLRVSGLRPSDQGTYRFRFHAAGYVRTDRWTSEPGQRLRVSGNRVPSSAPGSRQGPRRTAERAPHAGADTPSRACPLQQGAAPGHTHTHTGASPGARLQQCSGPERAGGSRSSSPAEGRGNTGPCGQRQLNCRQLGA